MGEDPTLFLHSVTFDSAGIYTCEAYMPRIPLLSRTRSFRLLVQGSGCGQAGMGTVWGVWGARTNEMGPRLVLLSSFSLPPFLSAEAYLSAPFLPHHLQGHQN